MHRACVARPAIRLPARTILPVSWSRSFSDAGRSAIRARGGHPTTGNRLLLRQWQRGRSGHNRARTRNKRNRLAFWLGCCSFWRRWYSSSPDAPVVSVVGRGQRRDHGSRSSREGEAEDSSTTGSGIRSAHGCPMHLPRRRDRKAQRRPRRDPAPVRQCRLERPHRPIGAVLGNVIDSEARRQKVCPARGTRVRHG